jgi:hypothetical protein
LLSTDSNQAIDQMKILAGPKDMPRQLEIILKETSGQTFKDVIEKSTKHEIPEQLIKTA